LHRLQCSAAHLSTAGASDSMLLMISARLTSYDTIIIIFYTLGSRVIIIIIIIIIIIMKEIERSLKWKHYSPGGPQREKPSCSRPIIRR